MAADGASHWSSVLDLREFETKGFTVLRGVVSQEEASRFLEEAVKPALAEQGLDLSTRRTWPAGASGMRVRAVDGSDHPISGGDKRWPAFFDSDKLRRALDALHGGGEGVKWRWNAGAIDGVGWIHLRFPIKERWQVPTEGWHLDETTRGLKTEASVVLLPIVTPLRGGAGGTALLRGSHLEIARAMRTAGSRGAVDWGRLQAFVEGYLKPAMLCRDPNAVEEARGEPGDCLVLHPLLYHAASDAVLRDTDARHFQPLCPSHQPSPPLGSRLPSERRRAHAPRRLLRVVAFLRRGNTLRRTFFSPLL